MDALLSPSSRSYYACIGESTHAFQSPSKDLDDINCRLNRFSFISFNKQIFSKNDNLLEAIPLTFVFSLISLLFKTFSTGRRLITGRINFDMVSDSVVAGSLGYQNGNSAPDGVAAFGLPIKREQADSDQTR